MYSQPVAVLGFHSTEEKSKQNWPGFPSWVEQNRDIQYCEFFFVAVQNQIYNITIIKTTVRILVVIIQIIIKKSLSLCLLFTPMNNRHKQ